MNSELSLKPPVDVDRVLLHTCCAPCSAAIIEALLSQGITPVIFFYNPNIYPIQEYLLRKEECMRYARCLGLEVIDGDYDHDYWLTSIEGMEHEPERGKRCLACFRMRLLAAARCASEQGLQLVTTTLAASRWKSLQQLESAGVDACSHYPSVTFWAHNWKKGGLNERRAALIKTYDFYKQPYCGCEFSIKPIQSVVTTK
ncbi:MAG: epoxyqueuosine reductase QueH [Phocaeicola sp.]